MNFGGYNWDRASSGAGIGTFGSKYISCTSSGYLQLGIANSGGTVYSSEIDGQQAMGYGTYTIVVQGPIALNSYAVLGLFTWDGNSGTASNGYREIDAEIVGPSAAPGWFSSSNQNSDFVSQWTNNDQTSTEQDYGMTYTGDVKYQIVWKSGTTSFTVSQASTGTVLDSWSGPSYTSPGQASFIMNLWDWSKAVTGSSNVVIKSFSFTPS